MACHDTDDRYDECTCPTLTKAEAKALAKLRKARAARQDEMHRKQRPIRAKINAQIDKLEKRLRKLDEEYENIE